LRHNLIRKSATRPKMCCQQPQRSIGADVVVFENPSGDGLQL
jgi:hypothetical protein